MKRNKETGNRNKGWQVPLRQGAGGQAMLMTVVLLSGAILSATALASLLILFQLRQAGDITASTKAVFAADAGIECVFFNKFRTTASLRDCGDTNPVVLDNGAEYRTIETTAGAEESWKSAGRFARSARAFEVTF